MAELFLARSTSPTAPARPVVIKRLLPHMASDPHFNAMFIDEAKLTTRLAHPNIAGTYELGRQGEQLYMVMEFVDGIDCLALLRECAKRKMRVPPEIAAYIAHETLDALDFAHTQTDDSGHPMHVVHRDISPSNLLLSRRGEIKLVDFGIARATKREHETKDGTLKGKYGYMSPEQVLEEDIDARSDLFSVGIVLAELLTGRRLFAARNELDVLLMVRDVRLTRLDRYGGHIDPALSHILRKSLSKQRTSRYSTAAEFRDVLADWMTSRSRKIHESDVAEVVNALYASVRERSQEPSDANSAVDGKPPAIEAAVPVERVLGEQSYGYPSIEMIEGIPAGRLESTDSLPVVSIEVSDSSRDVLDSGRISFEPVDGVVMATEGSDDTLTVDISDVDDGTGTGLDGIPSPIEEPERSEVRSVVGPGGVLRLLEANRHVSEDSRDFDDSLVSLVHHWRRDQPSSLVSEKRSEPNTVGSTPDDVGDFSDSPPITVFYRLVTTRASGLLKAKVGGIFKDVYFREGIPEYVTSNISHERFGTYLVEQGVLSSGELSMALAMLPHYNGKLGDTLVALSLLKPLDVFRLLTKQVRNKLLDLCTWSRGEFEWYGGRENPNDAFPLDLNAFEIMAVGAMELSDDVVTEWLTSLPLGCRPRVKSNPRVEVQVFCLGEFLDHMSENLNGEFFLSELQTYYDERGERAMFLRALYLLGHTDFIEFN